MDIKEQEFQLCREDRKPSHTFTTEAAYPDPLRYPDPLSMLREIYESGSAIMRQKNHDYRGGTGDPYANFRGSTNLGIDPIVGILLRVQDKIMRIKTFAEKGTLKVEGEGVKDALIDVTNYMALIWGLINETKP